MGHSCGVCGCRTPPCSQSGANVGPESALSPPSQRYIASPAQWLLLCSKDTAIRSLNSPPLTCCSVCHTTRPQSDTKRENTSCGCERTKRSTLLQAQWQLGNVSKFKTVVTKLLLLQIRKSSGKSASGPSSQVHVSVLSFSRLTDFSVLSQFLYWSIPSHFRIGSDWSLFNLGNSMAKGWRQVSESPSFLSEPLCLSVLCFARKTVAK